MRDYQEVFRIIPTPCVLLDGNDFSVLDINDSFFEATGLPKKDLKAKRIGEVFSAIDSETLLRSFNRLKQTGEKQEIPALRHQCESSESASYWNVKNSPLFDASGMLSAILVSIEDITDRVLLEKEQSKLQAENLDTLSKKQLAERAVNAKTEELKRSEAKFRALVQEGTDLIGILDYSGTYTFASESSRHIFGLPPDVFIGSNAFECIHPEDKETLMKDFYSMKPGEKRRLSNYRAQDAEGKWRWIESMAINLMEEPAVKGIVTHSQDITTIVEQAREIEVSHKRLQMAMRVTNEMIYDWDISADYVERSRSFEELYGFQLSDATSGAKFWFQQIIPEDQGRAEESLQKALIEKEQLHWKEEYELQKSDGELAYLLDRAVIIRDADGNPIRMVGAVLDVTDTRKMLNDIKRQNETLKAIAWEQSHKVRAPLVRLKGLLEFLAEDDFNAISQREVLEHIYAAADELDTIVRSIVSKTEKVSSVG